jgi:hypothetical protein
MTTHEPAGIKWRKSSYKRRSKVNAPRWHRLRTTCTVRDTKDRASGSLTFGAAQWRAFLMDGGRRA